MADKKYYEDYLAQYKAISDSLKNDDLTLDESIKKYKKSKEIYAKLKEILDQSKLEIEEVKE